MEYKKLNILFGWISFFAAAIVYLLTIEPTASFWDCGEFITSAYKLEVGHPPGAPFFMLLGRIFTLFAASPEQVALTINVMSALMSAFTIMFLFWTITHIAYRVLSENNTVSGVQSAVILASGLSGALVYTFSDSFWFSAVEGEVYASSSFFTALVFWAILKWENEAETAAAHRWLVFIAYVMGLSIGVHLLNLLAIPAIVLVYYFKKYHATRKGAFIALAIGIAILGVVQYGIIPGIPYFASLFELMFVNGFGLPFDSGLIFYILLLFVGISVGIWYSIKNNKVLLNHILTYLSVILIGYSSFALIIIRSKADTPMNQNRPDDMFSLLSYLNREQYGESPLLYGHYFNAPVVDYQEGKPYYAESGDRFEVIDHKIIREFKSEYNTIFPRMHSDQENHSAGYRAWAGITGPEDEVPSFGQNLRYFFAYQVNFMYMRYFFWNFVGRQNDIQGHGNLIHGNWISGIDFIDNIRLGDQSQLSDDLKNNKGRNKYYFLPLIFGILGMVWLYNRKGHGFNFFWILLLLFFFTGLAIVLYVNQPPFQPRERDYSYAGSFYVFAVYVGFGVAGLYQYLQKVAPKTISVALAAALGAVLVPGIMAAENWDDHDRSDRYTARDFAINYLESCAPNAIIFTNGDNDTFPLWYVQEVEGVRTDVRVINLSYLNTDWYIDQMKKQAYNSPPVPFSFKYSQYIQGTREIVYIQNVLKGNVTLKDQLEFVGSDDRKTKLIPEPGQEYDYFPSSRFIVPVDSATVIANGTVKPADADKIVPALDWTLGERNYVRKAELMVLDLIANSNWERPIYFAITVGPSGYSNLEKYFQLDGLAYRLVPIVSNEQTGQTGRIDAEIMYENLMKKFKWGGIEENQDMYLDENNLRMITNFRNSFYRLAQALYEQGDANRALEVLDRCQKLIPDSMISYNYYNLLIAELYYKLNKTEAANEIITTFGRRTLGEINYYFGLGSGENAKSIDEDKQRAFALIGETIRIAGLYKQKDIADELTKSAEQILAKYGLM